MQMIYGGGYVGGEGMIWCWRKKIGVGVKKCWRWRCFQVDDFLAGRRSVGDGRWRNLLMME